MRRQIKRFKENYYGKTRDAKRYTREYARLLAEQLEKIPETGDTFTFDKFSVTVTETENNRASIIEIKILTEETPEGEDLAVE